MSDKKTTKAENNTDKLPSPTEFYVNTPLYKIFKISALDYKELKFLLFGEIVFDCLCTECNQRSTFTTCGFPPGASGLKVKSIHTLDFLSAIENIESQLINVVAVCARDDSHSYEFIIKLEEDEFVERTSSFDSKEKIVISYHILKIGQFPTLADISESEINQFKHLLGEDRYRELKTGIGMGAHGVGIGSFVYLRRVLENLIKDAFDEAHKKDSWNSQKIKEYTNKNSAAERIRMLEHFVPAFMFDNTTLYGILSKGIHELTEEECSGYFELLKNSIVHILHEKKEKLEHEKRTKSLSSDINKLHITLK